MVFEKGDGLAKVKIYVTSGGQFSFVEEAWREYENPIGEPYRYWLPIYQGGRYASLVEAEGDARAAISWLGGHL